MSDGGIPAVVTMLGTLVLLLGLPASILGNEAATRFGRRRFLIGIMTGSAALACVVGFSAALPFWLAVTDYRPLLVHYDAHCLTAPR